MVSGKYMLQRTLGRGGMGVVFEAKDLLLGRRVALKTLPRMSPGLALRLRREARALAYLEHPNLATIHGAETLRGIPILVLELLDGTLADRLAERGSLPVSEVLDISGQLCTALGAIHDAGLLHRDVKPSNIGFAAQGTVKLMDFGLAKLLEAPLESVGHPSGGQALQATDWTGTTHGRVGTLPYMSPEALASKPPRYAFDLWSASVVLYECLTARWPFDGTDRAAIIASIGACQHRPARQVRPDLPSSVDEFFGRAFSRSPANRPKRADRLGELFELALAGRD